MPRTKREKEPQVKTRTKKTRKSEQTSTPTAKTEIKAPKNPLLELVGEFVSYYLEGWRCGTLVEITKSHARIRPIVSKYSKTEPNCIKVAFNDIKALDRL